MEFGNKELKFDSMGLQAVLELLLADQADKRYLLLTVRLSARDYYRRVKQRGSWDCPIPTSFQKITTPLIMLPAMEWQFLS